MVERRAARRQLAEHDVQIRHDASARSSRRSPTRTESSIANGKLASRSLNHAPSVSLGEPAEREARQRDAELACREHAGEISGGAQRDARLPVARPRHRLEARASRPDERELGGDEEAVESSRTTMAIRRRARDNLPGRRLAASMQTERHGALHSHKHAHDHAHGRRDAHAHARSHRRASHGASTRALAMVARRSRLVILVAEGVGGWLSNSLALLADAGHVLTDAGALGLSLFVAWFAGSRASPREDLRLPALGDPRRADQRRDAPADLRVDRLRGGRCASSTRSRSQGGLMLVVATARPRRQRHRRRGCCTACATAASTCAARICTCWATCSRRSGRSSPRSSSAMTGWLAADPIASLVTTLLIMRGAWRLVRESVDVLLEAAPSHIALDAVRTRLEAIPGVESVHDLHVWTVTSGMVAMSAHAIVREPERPPGACSSRRTTCCGDGHPARDGAARVRGDGRSEEFASMHPSTRNRGMTRYRQKQQRAVVPSARCRAESEKKRARSSRSEWSRTRLA